MDVAELVRAAQQGDVLAMSQLLDTLAPYVGRICGAIVLEAGEDAAQETEADGFPGATSRSWVKNGRDS